LRDTQNGLPEAERREFGVRLAEARRRVGMSQRSLADRLGVSLWTVSELELGRRGDISKYLPAVATATALPEDWFTTPAQAGSAVRSRAVSVGDDAQRADPRLFGFRNLVLGSIVLLVTVRFFTEVFPLMPRATNFIDIPIFLALVLAAMSMSSGQPGPAYLRVGFPAIGFLMLAIVSATINSDRALPAPVLVFLYGFLAPLAVYAAVYRIWPAGNAGVFSRSLVALGLLQLTVVALIDLPRFAASGNPDLISGTFGTNAYQLVFFLLVVAALLAGIFAFEARRRVARFVPLLIVAIFAVILLAQYRALLATTAVTVLVVSILLGTRLRGVLAAALAVLALGVAFSYVAPSFPGLRLQTTATNLTQSPSKYAIQRYQATRPVAGLYRDYPFAVAVGSGPGTFSSRAWQTFANAESTSSSNVQGGYAQRLTGGVYETDVSRRYVIPQGREGAVIEGSRALSSPHSSYLGLAAEVGLLGLALVVGVYIAVSLRIFRIARREIAQTTPGNPVPALALATTVGFLTLLQMGFLENWFEVTRITFIVWAMFAVVCKEVDSRSTTAS
jgi:transcriptional regulator with XRE-family HTH domain